jgi:RNA polymerase sigma factor (sigma-70 family)
VLGSDLRPLSALFSVGTATGITDRELLERYIGDSGAASEAAFAALVARHGPMVMGVCRRALSNAHDVDDAFQATFLVLVRKAGSVHLSDSLGRWLYGVSRKVASRARRAASRRPASLSAIGESWPEPYSPEPGLAEALDEEITRLPRRYQQAVHLCYLEGLALKEAADRIGCPVGTVGSRLSRAREILRARLLKRGVAPGAAAIALWLDAGQARSAVPASLVANVARTAMLQSAGTGSAVAGALTASVLRGITMMKISVAAGMLLAIGVGSVGLAMMISPQVNSKKTAAAPGRDRSGGPVSTRVPTRDDRLQAILDEFRRAQEAQSQALVKAKTQEEQFATFKLAPDTAAFTMRLLTLALEQPADRAGRDSAIWIVRQSMHHNDVGSWGRSVKRAMDLLLDHHPDDPEVGRLCLYINEHVSPNRVPFFEGLLARSKNREVRGLATYGLGAYLGVEAETIESLQASGARMVFQGGGGRLDVDSPESAIITREMGEYFNRLKKKDPAAVRARAAELLSEVIEHYGDIPDTRVSRINAAANDPAKAKPLSAIATAALHDVQDLREGRVAPAIDGTDLHGAPIKLADFRGKVVLLIFWGTWCGNCIAEVPHERELAKKLEGRPFTILGIDAGDDREDALRAVNTHKMSWPQVFDGDIGTGKVVAAYNVKGFPTIYLIDEAGVIRARGDIRGAELLERVETLVKDLESRKAAAKS